MTKSKFDTSILKVLLALSWPTMLEQLMQSCVQYIDTAMVGSLGTTATAAVGSTTTVNWLIGSTISSLGVGFLSYISQMLGAKQVDKAKNAIAQSFVVVAVVGIAFTVITTAISPFVPVWMNVDKPIRPIASRYFLILYTTLLFRTATTVFGTILRAMGDTKTPMYVGITVNVVNIILNFFLIYDTRDVKVFSFTLKVLGAGLHVTGAAIASAISFAVGGIAITVKLLLHRQYSPRNCSFKPDMTILRRVFYVAIPNMLQRFATSLGYVVFASMINALGEISTAAHTIANTVESAFYIPGYGMQQAAATLAGNFYGAGNTGKLKQLRKNAIPVEIIMMTVTGGLLFAFAPWLMSIFSKDTSVIELGSTVLSMVAVSEPFYGVTIVLEGMMQGVGNTKAPFIFNVIGMWVVRIGGTALTVSLMGHNLVWAWGCMIAHNLALFVMFVVYYAVNKGPMKVRKSE